MDSILQNVIRPRFDVYKFSGKQALSLFYKKGNMDVPTVISTALVCFYHWLHTLESTQRPASWRQTLIPLAEAVRIPTQPGEGQIADGVK